MERQGKTPSGGKKYGKGGLLACLAMVTLLGTGCATKIPVNMLLPADFHEASLTKTVAVLPFTGPNGSAVAAEFEAVLGGINIDNRQYFTIVDRASIDQTVSELKLGQSGLVDANTAARIGDLVGAQGIYTGVVTQSTWNDSRYRETRQECVEREVKREGNRTVQGNCIRWQPRPINCTKRVASFALTPRLIEVRTSKVLYSRNLTASADAAGCEDGKPLPAGEELLERAQESVKDQFRKDIAPHYITRQITLMDDKAGISSTEAKDRLSLGMDYAAKGRLDQACELWGQARILSPNAPSLLFDLGVCAESRGDFDAALGLYREADRKLGKPDDSITLALSRMDEAIKNRKKLEAQLK